VVTEEVEADAAGGDVVVVVLGFGDVVLVVLADPPQAARLSAARASAHGFANHVVRRMALLII
jgi:hypothetical protein